MHHCNTHTYILNPYISRKFIGFLDTFNFGPAIRRHPMMRHMLFLSKLPASRRWTCIIGNHSIPNRIAVPIHISTYFNMNYKDSLWSNDTSSYLKKDPCCSLTIKKFYIDSIWTRYRKKSSQIRMKMYIVQYTNEVAPNSMTSKKNNYFLVTLSSKVN